MDNGLVRLQPDRRIQNCQKTMNLSLCFQLNIDNISLEVWVWKSDVTAESTLHGVVKFPNDIITSVKSCP